MQASGDAGDYLEAHVVVLNNRALCHIQNGEARAAVNDCTAVLEIEPTNGKALVRRGKAYEMREKYKDAFADYKAAVKIGVPNAMTSLTQVISTLEQFGEGSWVRKNR